MKLLVFWSSRKLTSLRGTGASSLPPLTIFHSLSALQLGLHCTQSGHQQQASRSRYIPAQHRCARMTRSPALPPCLLRASARPNKFCSCSCRRCCFLMMSRSLSSSVGSGRASVEATGPVSVFNLLAQCVTQHAMHIPKPFYAGVCSRRDAIIPAKDDMNARRHRYIMPAYQTLHGHWPCRSFS